MTLKLSNAVLNTFHPRKGNPQDATLSDKGSLNGIEPAFPRISRENLVL